jgi:hypothetical protein
MPTIQGKVESKSRKGNSIKIDGDWYGCFSPADLNHVEWKDEVKFSWEPKGEYKNIKGPVVVVGSDSGGGGGSSAAPVRNGNLGVELGHASNLAMRMMEQNASLGCAVGSTDYYKKFAEYTVDMYRVMQGLRVKVSAPDFSSDAKMTVVEPVPVDATVEDIF